MSHDIFDGDPLGLGNAPMTRILISGSLEMCAFLLNEGATEEAREEAEGFLSLVEWLLENHPDDLRPEWVAGVIASVDKPLRELPGVSLGCSKLLDALSAWTVERFIPLGSALLLRGHKPDPKGVLVRVRRPGPSQGLGLQDRKAAKGEIVSTPRPREIHVP